MAPVSPPSLDMKYRWLTTASSFCPDVLRFGECAADRRRDAEQREERSRDRLLRDHLGRLSRRRHAHTEGGADRRHVGEDVLPVAPVEEVGGGDDVLHASVADVALPDDHESDRGPW